MSLIKSFLTTLLLLGNIVCAQNRIAGNVTDVNTTQRLQGAAILLKANNKMVAKTSSDNNGNFNFSDLPSGVYDLVIRYIGYDTLKVPVILKGNIPVDLHIELTKSIVRLEEVQIVKQKQLITIHADTVIIDATQLHTPENSSLRKLFERIPGVTQDEKGNYYYQNRKIEEITIDGRKSFQSGVDKGADPKKLEELFRADLVSKIELSDVKTQDGRVEPGAGKTMNLQLKDEARNKFNGSAMAGKGTEDIYNIFGSGTIFGSTQQIMASIRSNNANLMSGNELRPGPGSFPGRNSLGGGEFSFNTDINKKVTINAAANLDVNHYSAISKTERINLLQSDSSYRYENSSKSDLKENFGFFRLSTIYKVNERTTVGVQSFLNTRNNSSESLSSFKNFKADSSAVIGFGNILNTDKVVEKAGDINFLFSRMGKVPMTGIFVNFKYGFRNTDNNQININSNGNPSIPSINQSVKPNTNGNNYNFSIHYTTRIDSFIVLSLSANADNNVSRSYQSTFDFDIDKKEYHLFNDSLSYRYKTKLDNKNMDAAIGLRKGKMALNLRLAYIYNNNESLNLTDSSEFHFKKGFLSPSLAGEYKISSSNTFRFFMDQHIEAPELRRMVPISSLKNTNYIVLGNPDLKPAKTTAGSVSFNSVKPTGLTFSVDVMAFHQDNGIVDNIVVDSLFRQVSKAENANGIYNLSVTASVGGQIKRVLSINFQTVLEARHSPSFVNGIENICNMNNVRTMLSANMFHKKADFSTQVIYMYTQSKYSLQKNKFTNSVFSINFNASTETILGIRAGSMAGFNGNSTGNQHYLLVNAWLSKAFFPTKCLEAKLYFSDLLNQNQSFVVEQSPTYVETISSNVLSRYAMLAVVYQFGKSKK